MAAEALEYRARPSPPHRWYPESDRGCEDPPTGSLLKEFSTRANLPQSEHMKRQKRKKLSCNASPGSTMAVPKAALAEGGLGNAVALLLGVLEDKRGLRCRPEPRELANEEDEASGTGPNLGSVPLKSTK